MLPIVEKTLRTSFVNASRKEVSDLTLPADFETLDWGALDYLGWRDPKIGRRAYAVVPTLDGDLIGILFRQAEASPRSRAQCSWCQDVKLPNDVAFYSAKRSGPAGRNGNTVGTLVCQDFQCSRNVRKLPPPAYEGYDVEAARLRRIEDLQVRAASFVAEV
ncbi:FBP domain-containing protein [Curtobacterium flaccumfaciens pv. flaccumfaciens]|uniref:FBP domain-containing protein n=1 Tax=Curtobacterium flaccumfaciens TaxID=2035 RepID=UPI00217E8811|nr:FBP domain-containing protein [Curtobacterium flaccumfaciens]MCS6567942.1 FBP domain-containing protein [Curtobacterium flaccumfaciens pv. flaccumfaciens]MCS6584044.1 FBP domain-containing protein [Curtobacterium flaccumfaciens pv. flaccumfaciens]